MSEPDDNNWKLHRWSGWPGAFCQDCFIDDPLELAVAENREDKPFYCPPCLPGKVGFADPTPEREGV